MLYVGMGGATKMYEFSDKFQTAFDPPSFLVNHVAFFFKYHTQKARFKGKNLQYKFLDWKWPLLLLWKFIRFGGATRPLV